VDSAAVVAAMAEASPEPVKTFSIGFTHERYNELPLARIVAERFGTDHQELIVEPDALEIIPRMVRHYGEPFADLAALPSFYLAEMARRHVTVALNGDGGDEAFAGYPRYVANKALARVGHLPRPLRAALARTTAWLPESGRNDSWVSRARRVGSALPLDEAGRHLAYMTHLNGLDRSRLYTPEYRAEVGHSLAEDVIRRPWRESDGPDVIDRLLDVDVQTYLPDDLLVKIDIATMASSLEARSPLLDHRFAEFAATLPSRDKVRGREKKVALRRALRGWVPDEVLDAPKRGFPVPLAEWFRGELREYVGDLLLDPRTRARGYFRDEYVRELVERHTSGTEDHSRGIWTLLNFELWHREFVDQPAVSASA
jgi:asparagine synthase (glutamine-hydrolysing)